MTAFEAVDGSHPPLREKRDLVIEDRDNVARFMTPAQVAEAQRRARDWKPK